MHTTIVASNDGQFKPGAHMATAANMATADVIFISSQNMKLAAAAAGLRVSRDIPRASKAPGSTTVSAP